ncbi:MAG: glycosyltransferase, partial [Calditrichaeota bacterium]|nr:glycosyltransferase [Calditrichota bacterium]
MEEWEKPRYDQLYRSIPDIWKCKSILYVGAHEGRIHFGDPIKANGLEIDVMEIWGPNVKHLRESVNWFNSVIQGDIREIDNLISRKYDIIFWWHGPEHIEKSDLFTTLKKIEEYAERYVVLGCPWGNYEQGEEYGNPFEVHTSSFYEQDFKRSGYQTSTIGTKDVRGSNLLAWKDMRESPEYLTDDVIIDGVGKYGQNEIVMNDDYEDVVSDLQMLQQLNNLPLCHIKIVQCSKKELLLINRLFKEKVISGIHISEKVRDDFPLVNILMFTYDRIDYTKSALENVISNDDYPFNLYLVDNHSTDGTVEWLNSIRKKYPNIRKITFNEENEGLPGPTNDFWRDVKTDLIGKVDNDVIVPVGWLSQLVEAHVNTEKVGIAGGYHFRPEDFNENEAQRKLYNENGVQIVSDTHIGGCCYLMKKSVQQKTGYMTFNPTLKIHGWTEYQHKIVNSGYVVGYLYPLIQLEYMDDPRSEYCLIEKKYQKYTRDIWKERGVDFVSSDQLTKWLKTDAIRVTSEKNIALDVFLQREKDFHNRMVSGLDGELNSDKNGTSMYQNKEPYYSYSRPEIQTLVNPKSRTILDVGCASGKLASELKEKLGAEVWGIEYVKQVAEQAKEHLDKVIIGTIEENLSNLPDHYFDTIIFADVLEHLTDPYSVVENIRSKLTTNGEFIASIPNVRHWSVLRELIEGKWEYQDAGILDKTHLKFFTLKSVKEMFVKTGYNIGHLGATVLNGQQITKKQLKGLKATGLDVSTLKEESSHYQYLVKANPTIVEIKGNKISDSNQQY